MDIVLERMLSLIPKKPDGKYVHGAKKEFCKAIGAPDNIISNWENGVTKSYRNYVYVTAAVYNISVDWLLGLTDQKEKTAAGFSDGLSDEESTFLEQFRLMSEEERKFLLAQMRGVTSSRVPSLSAPASSSERGAEPPSPVE